MTGGIVCVRILGKLAKRSIERSIEGKPYYKHYITMPVNAMDQLDWEAGIELEWTIKDKKLILKKEKL